MAILWLRFERPLGNIESMRIIITVGGRGMKYVVSAKIEWRTN